MGGDDDQHIRKGKSPMTEEQLLKDLEEKEIRESLLATMQMIGKMTKDGIEKVQRVSDLLYDIELDPLWEEMHAAMNENKAEENPVEKPVEKPVQILQKKRHLDLFIDEEEEEKLWEVHGKKMRLAGMEVMKKEYGLPDSDATASEDEHTISVLKEMIEEFREDERFGINDAVLAQNTDSEDEDDEEEGFDEEEEGSDEKEEGSDEKEDESDDSDSE
ncbi:glutamic acid-rich protein-like [Papaver somniferum]|uniref:glutamic acid-rich protein-like n=1 Tax=Papaver somniferum TaxID=3469 RepID=UPI000E6F5CFE|nr:glutamic acid-rich protein-like [Papaver somniferum]